jgi:hypothetical protein
MRQAIFTHLRLRGHSDLVVLPKASGICIVHRGKFFALELRPRGKSPTKGQLEFMTRVNDAGGSATWADDLGRALAMLDAWGLFKRRVKDARLYERE